MRALLFTFLLMPAIAYGQDPRPDVTSGVPADVFNYFAWAAGIIILGLVGAVVALFRGRSGGLSAEEHEWLKWLKETHDSKDADGILSWMVPRASINEILTYVKKQEIIDEYRDRLEQEQTDRREQVETLLREQKDIMQGALSMTNSVGQAIDQHNVQLDSIKNLLERQA